MKSFVRPCILSLAFLVTFAAKGADELSRFSGMWRMARAELGGQPVPADAIKGVTIQVDGEAYIVTRARGAAVEEIERGTFSIQPEAKPKALTLAGSSGQAAGKTAPAIYEFDGDTLRICYDLAGQKRPAEFKTAAGTREYLVTYERLK